MYFGLRLMGACGMLLWQVIVEEGAGGGKGICYKMRRISMGWGYGANLKWEWPMGQPRWGGMIVGVVFGVKRYML